MIFVFFNQCNSLFVCLIAMFVLCKHVRLTCVFNKMMMMMMMMKHKRSLTFSSSALVDNACPVLELVSVFVYSTVYSMRNLTMISTYLKCASSV